jgi:hypothetical protein
MRPSPVARMAETDSMAVRTHVAGRDAADVAAQSHQCGQDAHDHEGEDGRASDGQQPA